MSPMETLVSIHSLLRWLVLAAMVGAIVIGLLRTAKKAQWVPGSDRPYRMAAVLFDAQVALGVVLWLGHSGWDENLFVGVIHPIGMLVSLGLVHMGVAKAKRVAETSSHRTVALAFLIALVVVALTIPWVRA